jgi:glycosyltransferase involved in cell wall biosynthesis
MPAGGVPAVYLNTSHGRLFRRAVSRWLGHSGIGGVFFVHDLIPLEFPEFNRPQEPARHALRLETVAAHARQIIVNSAATRAALLRHLRQLARPVPPIEVLHLGVERRFSEEVQLSRLAPTVPYFVVLGTIEPRKNHLLLLQVWRRLVEEQGDAAPRLVLIGRRGWENQTVFNILDRAATLAPFLVEASGLGDHDIATLMRGARAVLAPSFGEGFGLPVAEALALGVPVIASSIPAHREVGGDHVQYLDPLDGPGWLRTISDRSKESAACHERRLRALAPYRPPTWEEHLSSALHLIRDAARPVAAPAAPLTMMQPE